MRRGQLLHFAAKPGFDEGIASGEVAIKGARANAGLFWNVVEAGVYAEAGQRLFRDLEDALAVPLRVDARRWARLAPGG
ncbi:MAG TPA: hypothetical protein VME18_12395 [Acidobacteriaceae bacterium]|nr:hypothetical protein [Acidobacteriaceae bacterium]